MHELNRGGMQNAWPAWAGQLIDSSCLLGHVDLPAPRAAQMAALLANENRRECQGHYPKLDCPGSQRQVVEISNTESLVARRHTRARAIKECEVALDRAKVPPEKSED